MAVYLKDNYQSVFEQEMGVIFIWLMEESLMKELFTVCGFKGPIKRNFHIVQFTRTET